MSVISVKVRSPYIRGITTSNFEAAELDNQTVS